jgi:hypothetical protein
MVKVAQYMPGTEVTRLVAEIPLAQYSLQTIAASYGPGRYMLVLSGDPSQRWSRHEILSISVAPEYATTAGWDPNPRPQLLPSVADTRTLDQAARSISEQRPMTAGDVASLIETITNGVFERVRPLMAPRPIENPMGGVEQMMGMFTFFNQMNERAESRIMKLAGIPQPKPEEEEEMGWPGIIKQGLPILGNIVQGIMNPPKQQVLGAQQPMNAQPQVLPMTSSPSSVQPESTGSPEKNIQVPLTPEEIKQVAPAVNLLRPFVGFILEALEKAPTGEAASTGMETYIGEAFEEPLYNLAMWTEERGPLVLAIIDPALATVKGREMILALANRMFTDEEEPQPAPEGNEAPNVHPLNS